MKCLVTKNDHKFEWNEKNSSGEGSYLCIHCGLPIPEKNIVELATELSMLLSVADYFDHPTMRCDRTKGTYVDKVKMWEILLDKSGILSRYPSSAFTAFFEILLRRSFEEMDKLTIGLFIAVTNSVALDYKINRAFIIKFRVISKIDRLISQQDKSKLIKLLVSDLRSEDWWSVNTTLSSLKDLLTSNHLLRIDVVAVFEEMSCKDDRDTFGLKEFAKLAIEMTIVTVEKINSCGYAFDFTRIYSSERSNNGNSGCWH